MFGKSHCYGSNNTRLNHGEYGPTIYKAHSLTINARNEIVLSAGIGHHRSQLAKAQCRHQCNYPRENPSQQNQRTTTQLPRHI